MAVAAPYLPRLDHIRAILWVQARTLWNFYRRGSWGVTAISTLLTAGWYGMVAFGAVSVSILVANPPEGFELGKFGARFLFLMLVYWQFVPIVTASTRMSLDIKRIIVYPIGRGQLYLLELILRLSTAIELLLITAGVTVGLLRNSTIPKVAALALLPWLLFNLLLSAGVRDVVGRWLAHRRGRELMMIAFVAMALAPQLLLRSGVPPGLRKLLGEGNFEFFPWVATAKLALGQGTWLHAAAMAGCVVAAGAFSVWQFRAGLRTDAATATPEPSRTPAAWSGVLGTLVGALPDPLAALVDKEIRILVRAPRFRLVFLMGFTFGLVVCLPLSGSDKYLPAAVAYSLLLLGDLSFWNTYGFDRRAVQMYFAAPAPFRTVMVAKNLVAVAAVTVEFIIICGVSYLFRFFITPALILQTFTMLLVQTILLIAAGNLASVTAPRPLDPGQWRNSPGRMQALLFLLYPVLAIPNGLALLARWAFECDWAFYGVEAVMLAFAGVVYWVALESAEGKVRERKEQFIGALSAESGPING